MGLFSGISGLAGSILGSGAASALGSSSPWGAIAGSLGSAMLGDYANERGVSRDLRSQQAMFDYRIQRGLESGLTPYEMFMGPAGGAGGGVSNSGATLGNAASTAGQQAAQFAMQAGENQKDRAKDLQQTKMQNDTQKEIAEIQAGVTTRGQDINYKVAQQTLALDQKRLEVEVHKAGASIGLTKAQTQKTLNEVVTSDKDFMILMKQLSMGKDNLLVELTLRDAGISLTNPNFENMPPKERKALIDRIIALSSTAYVEGQGANALGAQAVEAGVKTHNTIFQAIVDVLGMQVGKLTGTSGIEPAGAPTLGTDGKPGPSSNRSDGYIHYNQDFPGRN